MNITPVIDITDKAKLRAMVEAAVAEEEAVHGAAEEEPGKDEGPRRSFRFLGLDELLSEPRPTRWLIRDYLEESSLACLFGASGSMKSFVALDMGLCLATGKPWHGQDVGEPGPVFYICGEGFNGVAKRLRAWFIENDVDQNAVPFFVSNSSVEFLDGDSLQTAIAAIDELAAACGAPKLVIVDTLARNFGPGDENSTQDMGAFVAALDSIRAKFGCAVLTVHHTGLNETNRARGASAFRAAMDFEYRLESKESVRVLACTKSKDHEEPKSMAFEYEVIDTGWADDMGEPMTSVVLHLSEAKAPGKREKPLRGANKVAYEALMDLATCGDALKQSAKPVDIEAWRAETYRRSISASADQGSKQRAFHRAITFLRDAGLIATEDDIYWPTSLPRQTRQDQTSPDNCLGTTQTDKTHSYRSVLSCLAPASPKGVLS